MGNFRLNWVAILVAAIVSFLFEALWYSVFLNEWVAGIGRTDEWLHNSGVSPPVQNAVAILCSIVVAAVLTICIQASGEQTAIRGVIVAGVIWLGFIATFVATEYIFEVRSVQLYAINTGYALIDYMIIGAIVGAWKKKSPPALH
jgi:uncharacterized membrane protein YraQ (UPF0718 family)